MFALQPEMKIFSGSANRELAQRICDCIGAPLGQATISSFPDGETYVKIEENIRGRDVFIIQPTSPPTNQHLMELLIMVDARSEEHTSELQSPCNLVCRLLLEKKKEHQRELWPRLRA